ncbi:MAG: phosphoenolpyruvate carboxylase [Robiginitomaculum sp.]|nr:phosphoenolpyruvate carboxylase [Robiginitomaculum sp.]MDQ7078519.1 phosphoenolpyruvate carboxylase [Robiginitomaculum sp.]
MTGFSFPDTDANVEQWASWCLTQLKAYEGEVVLDPQTNSVRRLGYALLQALQGAHTHGAALAATAKHFADQALFHRADTFAAQHQEGPMDQARIDAMLAPLSDQPFADVQSELERTRAGIVFTAHPTFAMSATLRRAVAAYASAQNDNARDEAKAQIRALAHAPDPEITLTDEHEAAQLAITRAQQAVGDVTTKILVWARRHFPDDWTAVNPAPISLASWVGYDLDGRTDIHWGQTIRIRLLEKSRALADYADDLAAIDLGAQNTARDALVATLRDASGFAAHQANLFDGDLDDPAVVTRAANTLTRDDKDRLISLKPVLGELDALLAKTDDEAAKLALCVLRARMRNLGLGVARIHLRINAAQLISALRADLGLGQGRAFADRTALDAAAAKARTADQQRINLASIFLEPMTARRQFMLCAEFLKHVDADTPIRFLIAECEAPATVMGAIYLARLYGVDHLLDISPLFETPLAMERGGRLIERLLEEEEFVEYIRARGRLAVQIGFSDSGRFMGQIASNCAIERLQILLARALAAKNIRNVEVLIFNTHGESMGRGAYPGTLQQRFDYLITPWTRSRYAHEGLPLNAETSFQGGDGFLHFETPHLAGATVGALLQWGFARPQADKGDRFYADINYSWDFYRSIKSWQENLFENVDYQVSVGAFAAQMLFTTGSRKARRQSGAAITGPKSLRAIPHNAILQQLAAPVNVFGGAGHAAGLEPDRFIEQVNGSARMREILGMIRKSRALTSLPAMRAYGVLFDASFWISKAAGEDDPQRVFACEQLAQHLGERQTPRALGRFANHIAADLSRLDKVFEGLDGENYAHERHAERRTIHALHAIRQAMIMQAFILTASLPSFSQRHDCTRATVLDLAFALRFDELADLLGDIFPLNETGAAAFAGITEPSDDARQAVRGYPHIHKQVIQPLRFIHQSIREIGVGLSHHYGAYG